MESGSPLEGFGAGLSRELRLLFCYTPLLLSSCGEVSEWLKEHAWKACSREIATWVRIPPSPPCAVGYRAPPNANSHRAPACGVTNRLA